MLVLRTFGGLSLENGGRPIIGAAGQPRRLAVLAVVAVAHDAGISRERLCALLWPDSDAERARGALKQALYALRRDVKEQDLVLGANELRLNPALITSDVGAFNAALSSGDLTAAVARYAGPFLDGVHLRGESEFERWADDNRRALATKYANALEKLTVVATDQGDAPAAVDWARQLNVADALNTRAALLLINALDAGGDRAGAIKQGEVHAALLRYELEVEPSDEFTQTMARLREPPGVNRLERAPMAPATIVSERPPFSTIVTTPDRSNAERTTPADSQMPRWWRRHATTIAAAALAVALVAAAVVVRRHGMTELEVVVVLPLENDTGDPAFDVVGRMAADWIAQGLRQTSAVDVIDSRTAFADREVESPGHPMAESAVAAARRTGATTIVRGAIYRSNDTLSLHAQIIHSANARVIAELSPVTAPARDPGRLVEAARQRVLGAFAAFGDTRFAAWENAVSEPPRYDAYQEFILGLDDFGARRPTAFGHFLAAAQLDTNFVQAKLFAIETNGAAPPERARALSDSLLRASIRQRDRLSPYDRAALDRRVGEARGDIEFMLEHSRRMVKLAPHSSEAHVWHALDALQTNRFHESLAELHRERPRGTAVGTPPVLGIAGESGFFERIDPLVHHLAGEYDEELSDLRVFAASTPNDVWQCVAPTRPLAALGRASAVDSIIARCALIPNAPVPGAASAYLSAGREYRAHGHDAEAQRALVRARETFHAVGRGRPLEHAADFSLGDWAQVRENWRDSTKLREGAEVAYGQLGVARAHLGDRDGALAMEAALEQEIHPGYASPKLWQAMIEEALGNRRRALSLIQEAVAGGVSAAVMLHTHAATGFASMRSDPAFQVWLRER